MVSFRCSQVMYVCVCVCDIVQVFTGNVCVCVCVQVYMMTWVERKMAAALFAVPPTATIDEALCHFMEVLPSCFFLPYIKQIVA